MASNDYHFLTHWHIPGTTIEEVYAVISDVEALPVWWPSVYLSVTPVPGTGDRNGIGKQYDLMTKGWLPYTIAWRLTVQENHPPHGSTIGASWDFNGRGIWSFLTAPTGVDILFDWKLTADKPLLRSLSWLLKPFFAANHGWAMAQGRTSLVQELERRRKPVTPVTPPPGPTTWEPYAVFGGVVAALVLFIGWAVRSRKSA